MKQYHDHLQLILDKGTHKPAARESMPSTQSLFGHQSRYNLQDGFPLLTTKKINFKQIVIELLWFLKGKSNIKYLVDNGCNIWNEDAYNYYLKKGREYNLFEKDLWSIESFISNIKGGYLDSTIKGYKLGDTGVQYPKTWRNWEYEEGNVDFTLDQIRNVIESLTNNPQSRRHIVTSIDPTKQNDLALYWCHSLFQFNARPLSIIERITLLKDTSYDKSTIGISLEDLDRYTPKYYLDCHMYQRSADMFLGVPYNIASYALLTHIVAKVVGMIPGDFIHSFGDSHIYENHKAQVEELLSRDVEKYELPTLYMDIQGNLDIYNKDGILEDFIHTLEPTDFNLINYQSYPAIKAKLSTGLK